MESCMFWSGLFWNASGYTCSGSFGKQPTTVAKKQHFCGGDIYAESAVAVKSIEANIPPQSTQLSSLDCICNEQVCVHVRVRVTITFVFFSFSCLGRFLVCFCFVLLCFSVIRL